MNEIIDSGASRLGGPFGMPSHPERATALGEIHSRPFTLVRTPRAILQLAFITDEAEPASDLAVLAELCRMRGLSGPDPEARHHTLEWGSGTLRWERHTEFTAWWWVAPAPPDFLDPLKGRPFGNGFRAPGQLISAVRLDVRTGGEGDEEWLAPFDPVSLCWSEMDGGLAKAATDFRQDADGLTRILVVDGGLGPARAGALSQRLIEIETYRTLAMLGLPVAQALGPRLRRIQSRLAEITAELRDGKASDGQRLLDELIDLAAELEADAVAALHRFGASRAYDEIVGQRLAAVGEQPISGYETWSAFLKRRLQPAMRTCRSVEERQASLSQKLARGANLLRTRIDVELERQNRDLLSSMNRRARLQLRLQRTVEGLSVAAVSYYVVGLLYYLFQGAEEAGLVLDPTVAAAAAVPPVVLAVWWMVRRIRRRSDEE
ncbi:MAG TPA: DUF3422 domain-containing protein [Afifellaceae bacterium]|nr:DUF3422 domain-containing protein [Afifellaceae bacterium]